MEKINIQEIIKDNHIITHKELQDYLYELGGGIHYWHYDKWKDELFKKTGLLDKCELVELEGKNIYYEVVEIV